MTAADFGFPFVADLLDGDSEAVKRGGPLRAELVQKVRHGLIIN